MDEKKDDLILNLNSDTRAESKRILGEVDRTTLESVVKTMCCLVFSLLCYSLPLLLGYEGIRGLQPAGEVTLMITIFAASLWITEAMPAFAVGLLVIALEIAFLGRPGGVFAAPGDTKAWQLFVSSWSSPLIWLFFGGFVLTSAITKTEIDILLSKKMLNYFGKNPIYILAGFMLVTFVLSMFMSNTATATMMIALVIPISRALKDLNYFSKALLISVPVAANLGGMGTIIGTPPNAIAVAQLESLAGSSSVSFLGWMVLALPPALILLAISWFLIIKKYKFKSRNIDVIKLLVESNVDNNNSEKNRSNKFNLERKIVIWTFLVTVLLWMSEKIHHIPTAVISFIPITVLSITGVITSREIRKLPWEVLILLAGGLSLGIAVKETGLGEWFANIMPISGSVLLIVFVFVIILLFLSNIMSNTAAASVILPIALGISSSLISTGGEGGSGISNSVFVMVILALTCSCAMLLPISTPPNAVAYSTGKLNNKEFIFFGTVLGVLGPLISLIWIYLFM